MSTSPKSATDILGYEFDWLARDADDYVALFSTAGGGYAPEEFLRDTDAHQAAIDAILALPASTRVRFAPVLTSEHQNTWFLVAERGLFAFDADPNGGPYQLIAAPDRPVRATALPASVTGVLRELQFQLIRFDTIGTLSDDSLRRE